MAGGYVTILGQTLERKDLAVPRRRNGAYAKRLKVLGPKWGTILRMQKWDRKQITAMGGRGRISRKRIRAERWKAIEFIARILSTEKDIVIELTRNTNSGKEIDVANEIDGEQGNQIKGLNGENSVDNIESGVKGLYGNKK